MKKTLKKQEKKSKDVVTNKKVHRTTLGLRNALFEELDLLRAGKSTPQKSNAVAKSASAIVGVTRLEIDYNNLALNLTKKGLKPGMVLLGNSDD